jgi:Na+-transporting NADH:ubiquinone oxidoreductase subunit C
MPDNPAARPARSNDTAAKTLTVTLVMCLVCSLLVSGATVLLRPYQERNRLEDRKRNILQAAGLLAPGMDIDRRFEHIEARLVDLDSGRYVDAADPESFDERRAAKDPQRGVAIPKALDRARIRRRAKLAPVYLVKDGERVETVVLPVYGAGLYSTLYGYLALAGDANTVVGLSFYEQGETPGLGGNVASPRWLAKWPGKRVYDDRRERRIEIVKGGVDADSPDAIYRVDSLSGATLTSAGVSNLLAYWLDDHGYRPFLSRIAARGRGP